MRTVSLATEEHPKTLVNLVISESRSNPEGSALRSGCTVMEREGGRDGEEGEE